MTWPPWALSSQEIHHNYHQQHRCNPELVAKLEAERLIRRPRWKPTPDTPEEIAKRHQLATEIALYNYRKKA